jgi:CubicO group peptidase (beta-lactamase class C family)
MPDIPEIRGSCDERFTAVRHAMTRNFREHNELGAAVAVFVEGRPVVDLWAGWADIERTRAWQRDTLVNVFSVGKPMAALSLLVLVDRGQVDIDAPVADYWPEFGTHGKGNVSVRMLLAHQAGLPAVRESLPGLVMYDWELMTSALAREQPWWAPGTRHGYHVNTFGFLAGEIVRRVSGSTLGDFFREEIAERLAADFHFGVAAEEDGRIADCHFASGDPLNTGGANERGLLLQRAYFNPPGISGVGTVNTREWRAAQIPSTNGHATARAVARIYSALVCQSDASGVSLLRQPALEEAIAEASSGPDFVLGRPSRFGLGFQLTQPERPLGPNPRSFGHFGAGGSLGFADPDTQLAFAYVMNRPGSRWQDPRNRALISAVYASL